MKMNDLLNNDKTPPLHLATTPCDSWTIDKLNIEIDNKEPWTFYTANREAAEAAAAAGAEAAVFGDIQCDL